jgi:hypothetical protein
MTTTAELTGTVNALLGPPFGLGRNSLGSPPLRLRPSPQRFVVRLFWD